MLESESAVGAETAFPNNPVALPSDESIIAAESFAQLRELLGSAGAPGLDSFTADGVMHGNSSLSPFTLKDQKIIETLDVFSLLTQREGTPDGRVEGVRASRGTDKPWQE